jgi:membrane fusion protein, macrolide-specific efflux system
VDEVWTVDFLHSFTFGARFGRHISSMTRTETGETAMTKATTERVRDALRDRARRLWPRRRRTRAAALAALLTLAAGGAWGVHAWAARDGAADQLTVATVQRGDLEDTVTATGILQPRDYVDVGTQVSGQLRRLHVEIGSTVKAGQLIAEIDPAVYQSRVEADEAQLRTQQAQLVDKQAQFTLAEQQHERQVNMMKDDATTQEALQTAEAALRSARAQIDVLKAQIEQTQSTLRGDQASLSYTKIYAPMSGTVVAQSAKQGQTLNANQQAPLIVRIADLSTMTVQSQVSEADVSKLRAGMPVYFATLGDTGKRWYGTLRQINPTPETVNNVVLYDALFDVDNHDGALMTQMTAQVFFVAAQAKGAVLVPVSALRPLTAPAGSRRGARSTDAAAVDPRTSLGNGPAAVRVVASDGSIAPRDVRVGLVSRVSAQIVSGLEPGERVVVGQRATTPAAAKPAAGGSRPMMGPRV